MAPRFQKILGRGITTGFPGTTSVPAEQNRITLESVVPEIFGPDLNSAEPSCGSAQHHRAGAGGRRR
jgi:hypothetical protein